MPKTYIGMSGWRYDPWRGTFYPKALVQKRELEYASRKLNSIEINGTFYSLQRPSSFRAWYDATPDDFVFSAKGPQFITHIRRLREVDEPVATFLASGILLLKEKLGPILWQFHPNFKWDRKLFEPFLKKLPHDTKAAAKLAQGHGKFLTKDRRWLETDKNRPLRHAVEIRNDSFRDADFIKLLRDHNVALVIADTGGEWPDMEDVTADFIYARLHGVKAIHKNGYTDAPLNAWARRFKLWRAGKEPANSKRIGPHARASKGGRDVHVYFDTEAKIRSPFDAMALARRLNKKV